MLLTVDIGNTNALLGIFLGDELVFHWRLKSDARRTQDEYWVYLDCAFSDGRGYPKQDRRGDCL